MDGLLKGLITTDDRIRELLINGLMFELMWEKHHDKFVECRQEAEELIKDMPSDIRRKIVAGKVETQGRLNILNLVRKINDCSIMEDHHWTDDWWVLNRDIIEICKSKSEEEQKPIGERKCPICSREITENEFRDDLSVQEFMISGLCQRCQDETFGDGYK
jgi:hypothetical protein